MGISIRVKDASFKNNLGSANSLDSSGLLAEFIFGGDDTVSLANKAGSTVATKKGNPISSDNFITIIENSDIIEFPVPNFDMDSGMTLVSVVRGEQLKTNGHAGFYSKTASMAGFVYTGTSQRFTTMGWTGSSVATAPTSLLPNNTWVLSTGTSNSLAASSLNFWIDGVKTKVLASTLSRAYYDVIRGFQVGGQPRGSTDWAYIAVYNRVLSDDEMDSLYLRVKATLASRGVDVS